VLRLAGLGRKCTSSLIYQRLLACSTNRPRLWTDDFGQCLLSDVNYSVWLGELLRIRPSIIADDA